MISAEVSIYPLKTSDASSIINNSINSLNNQGIEYSVGSISTHLHGSEEQVWKSLKEMFHNAQNSDEISMVITITNAAD
ncbi:MAG: hypothetical protein C4554_03360 [Dethiobacter sp.]|jgi:uncharacterized protein YqgV (UPF0045/DUF77 family)|nr:MAG: hypothetical protein C4554_03360 [Dethiobacter sp.]